MFLCMLCNGDGLLEGSRDLMALGGVTRRVDNELGNVSLAPVIDRSKSRACKSRGGGSEGRLGAGNGHGCCLESLEGYPNEDRRKTHFRERVAGTCTVEITASKEICEGQQELFIYPGSKLQASAAQRRSFTLSQSALNSHATPLSLLQFIRLRKDRTYQKPENSLIPCWIVGSIGVNGVNGRQLRGYSHSTHQYTLVHISTHQYTSVHISTHQYTLVGIHHTHSVDSIESIQTVRTQYMHTTHTPHTS